jgi:hypothetical protein
MNTHSASGTLYNRDLSSLDGFIDMAHQVALYGIRWIVWKSGESTGSREEEGIIVHIEQQIW